MCAAGGGEAGGLPTGLPSAAGGGGGEGGVDGAGGSSTNGGGGLAWLDAAAIEEAGVGAGAGVGDGRAGADADGIAACAAAVVAEAEAAAVAAEAAAEAEAAARSAAVAVWEAPGGREAGPGPAAVTAAAASSADGSTAGAGPTAAARAAPRFRSLQEALEARVIGSMRKLRTVVEQQGLENGFREVLRLLADEQMTVMVDPVVTGVNTVQLSVPMLGRLSHLGDIAIKEQGASVEEATTRSYSAFLKRCGLLTAMSPEAQMPAVPMARMQLRSRTGNGNSNGNSRAIAGSAAGGKRSGKGQDGRASKRAK